MAQVCGGSTYDIWWDERFEAAVRCLRSAAGRWAVDGRDALAVEPVLAALVRMLVGGGSAWNDLIPLERLLATVGLPADECRKARPTMSEDEADDIVAALTAVAAAAADRWSAGYPGDPSVEAVVCRLVATLFRHRVVQRPPRPAQAR